jgi:NodT family efflux transporter outer membrane factor (OMF) lipoprotein
MVLGGCAVGPDYKRPEVTLAASWSAGADPNVTTQVAVDSLWWRGFNDVTLNQLVELAYHQNLTLQVAGVKIIQARAQLAVATGLQFPQTQALFANASALGLSQNVPIPPTFPRNFLNYSLGFDAAWELDFWGKYRRGVQAEAAGMLASMADYYAALVSLTAEVARTYVTIRTNEVLVDLARENVRIQEDALKIAESRFRRGETSELDPTQATTLLESTRATIPTLQGQLQQARNALSTLLSQPPGTVEAMLAGPKEIPRSSAKVAIGVPAEMLRRRPDIRGAELNAAAQCAHIGIAKAQLYPSFSLVGTIGLQTATTGAGTPNIFSTNSIFYAAGPQISWPVFNYGRLTNAVRVEDARFQQLLLTYRDTVIRAAQEVEDALAGYIEAQQTAVSRQNAVTSAKRSVDLSLSAYREGAADYQRVLDAEQSLLQQQDNLAQANSSIATYLIAVYKALGGGWEWRQGQQFVPESTQREMRERTNWGDMLPYPPAGNPPSATKQEGAR